MVPLRKHLITRSLSVSASQEFNFIPKHNPVNRNDVDKLQELLDRVTTSLVLTGAGISTESGIPDYRSKGIGLYARSQRKPIQYQQFVKSQEVRKRYWTRNFVAWPRFSSHQPNAIHTALTTLQKRSIIDTVVTMNVDGLHRKAATSPLVELHGSAYEVMCRNCGDMTDRHHLQKTLTDLNPTFANLHFDHDVVRPDGDIEVPQEYEEKFILASCDKCGGDLMPNIVFFGDNVPIKRVQFVEQSMDRADALLILGSSVSTYSAYRICLQAAKANKPIAIVNIGATRADPLATIKVEAKCGDVVPQLCS